MTLLECAGSCLSTAGCDAYAHNRTQMACWAGHHSIGFRVNYTAGDDENESVSTYNDIGVCFSSIENGSCLT